MTNNVSHLDTRRGPSKPQSAADRIAELEELLRFERMRADAFQDIYTRLAEVLAARPTFSGEWREGAPDDGVNR
jgi:hypothetical protein